MILCLVLAAVLMVAFVLIQIWKPDQATVPPKIFMQRSIASGVWVSLCIGSHQTVYRKFKLGLDIAVLTLIMHDSVLSPSLVPGHQGEQRSG